jgi:putative transposase
MICDNDRKFGPVSPEWQRRVPLKYSECLDHLLILHEMQLQRVLNGYVAYFNRARPHQGIRQQIPELLGEPLSSDHDCGNIISCSVLGGLHHDYRRVA